jgi:hypothetical protein
LKAKGTLPALRTLITSYGIPDTVLRINEFGGKDKSNSNDWDDWQNVFNYAFFTSGSNKITTDWTLNSSWNSANNVPATLEFRFKIPNLSTVSGSPSIDLLRTDGESRMQLRYTGSGFFTASYSGSTIDPYYQYTHLDFYPDLANFPNSSASIYLPFANEGWWSVMVTRTGSNFTLYAGNNVYEGGENGTQLGFYATSSINEDSTGWSTSTTVDFMPQQGEMYLQEIRYYNTVLSESIFKDYIMNPSSTEGNSLNSSPDQLAFRLSLGGELYTGSKSIHPKVTGSWAATSSFVGYSSASFNLTPIFVPNTEYFFLDQPVVGIKNAISDKIRVENSVIPSGNTLSPFRSLAQNLAASQSYTVNTNLLEVAFAPQDEINDDIISQIGFFNIGEYIGDPRQRSSSATSYPDLDRLRNEYFQKYISNYNLNDYIRLIKYFDNSLFKMIKDFVPARTSLASGVVIKQTLLERNKYPQPQVSQETVTYTGSIESTQLWNPITQQKYISHSLIETFDGGAGGVFNTFNTVTNISQSWYETLTTPSGSVTVLHNSQDEFYDGEFSGSVLVVTTQSLAQSLPLDISSLTYNTTGSNSTTPATGYLNWQSAEDFNPATGDYSLYIPTLYVNEIDNNGVSIETALSNLTAGDTITFRVSASINDGGFPLQYTPTVTGIITSIVPTTPSVWRINLSNQQNSQATYYSPIIFYSVYSVTSSLFPLSSILLNPYLNSVPNFYNSDYNPLINNTEGDRLSTKFQDVDYSTGMVTPTNFNLLISGSALKAAVQDSNYTSKRVTLPRYEGSKSTSQNLNYWTPGDEGTYGKLPTVENLKTMVAYCDSIGGWPPERENASAVFVKYLIKSDGSVIIPNTSENSLSEIKGTFESGENLLISTKTISSGQPQQSRKVLRGGTRIEPVLYNQSGSMPGGSFVNTITLTDNNVTGSVISDFQARLGAASYTLNELNVGAFNDILFNRIISSGSSATISSVGSYLRYQGTTGLISEEVSLQLSASLQVTDTNLGNGVFQGSYDGYAQFAIVRRRSGVTTILTQNSPSIKITQDYQSINLSTSIPFNEIQNGDEFYVRGYANRSNIYVEYNSTFNIYQTPTPNASISISNLWLSSSSTTSQIQTATSGAFGTYLLITTSSALINYYGNPSIYQQDIANSGFNPIVTPWSIEYGDEFRFEGREDRVYQIKQAAVVIGTSVGITKPLLVVELNQPVPPSGSVNFDQFLIRRYVDDASQVLMEGFAPINSQGPYIVRPEFVAPELNKSVDQFILDLTQKGLIS